MCCDVALSDLTSVAEEVSWPTDLLRCVSVSAMLCFFKALLNFCILSDGALVFCFSFGQFPLELLKKQRNKNRPYSAFEKCKFKAFFSYECVPLMLHNFRATLMCFVELCST